MQYIVMHCNTSFSFIESKNVGTFLIVSKKSEDKRADGFSMRIAAGLKARIATMAKRRNYPSMAWLVTEYLQNGLVKDEEEMALRETPAEYKTHVHAPKRSKEGGTKTVPP